MPWVDATSETEIARPPRLPAHLSGPPPAGDGGRAANARPGTAEATGGGEPEIVDGWAELSGPQVPGATLDLRAAERIEATGALFVDNRLLVAPDAALVVRRSRFERCDLSQLRLESVRSSVLSECKLVGAELGGGVVDVELIRCSLVLTRLRGARLERVRFEDCTLAETDLFESELRDVRFDGSTLDEVDLDRARFERVDLRNAASIDVRNARSYAGCVITVLQAHALALRLANDAGFGIESPADRET